MHIHFAESLNATTLGYWGKRTSTLDWCEENYVVCKYIAEFHNTVTNAVFVLLALYGLHTVKKLNHEARFLAGFGTFMLVGIGSWFFHMTLLYEMQLLDELPMLYATCVLIYSAFETKEKIVYGWRLPALLTTVAVLISTIYVFVKSPLFHQWSYALLTAVLVFRALYMFNNVPAGEARNSMRRLLISSWTMYALGFLSWNIDNEFCPQIRAARAYIGAPWDSLLQLHGWWHILTGLGSYAYIVFGQYLRQVQLGKSDLYTIRWTMGVLPTVTLANSKVKSV
ncbi:alkaline ceramidase 3-like protein [Syncephalis fuscata]|nr:alkaline ceramidase 3-like protein [Syncephalis fuscata]